MPRPVGAVRDHGVEGVGNGDDAGHHRDRPALQLVGVARSVPAFVVVADGRGQDGCRSKGAGERGAQDRVFLDLGKLFRRVAPLFVQQFFRQADLPDVVQQAGVEGDLLVLRVEADQPRQGLGGDGDPVIERLLRLGRVFFFHQLPQAFLGASEVASQLLEAKQCPHADLEVAHRDRLDDQVVAARLHHLGALRPGVEARHHQHRDLGGFRVRFQLLTGLVPVHHRHLDVHQDQVRLQPAGGADGLLAIGGGFRPEAQGGKLSAEQVPIGAAVVRDQDGPAFRHRSEREAFHWQ